MSCSRYIGTALTIGRAIVAIGMLSSPSSEAKARHAKGHHVKKGVFVGSKAFKTHTGKAPRFAHKRTGSTPADVVYPPGKDPKDPPIGKVPPVSSHPLPPGTYDPGKLPWDKGPKIPAVVSREPLPPGTYDPGKLPWDKGPKLPPVVKGDPLPPGTYDPGKLPPGNGPKLPPVVESEPLPPGKLPPGGKTPPPSDPTVVIKGPVVVPPPPPPTRGPSKGDLGTIPVNAPDGTESCDRCAWLKANYDQSGLARWLDRYRLCLTWLRAS
jgi:hypothetical protein